MRRKDREIKDFDEIYDIVKECKVCHLAFCEEGTPYVIPLNFGCCLEQGKLVLYFHGARQGRKIDFVKKNTQVAFSMVKQNQLVVKELACENSTIYESVCGEGRIQIVNGDERLKGLTVLMNQLVEEKEWEFEEKYVNAVAVLKVTVSNVYGKRKG